MSKLQQASAGVSDVRRATGGRILRLCLFGLAVTAALTFAATRGHVVQILDGDAQISVYTFRRTADEILAQGGVTLGEHDKAYFDGFSEGGTIRIVRAFPVTVTADGRSRSVMTTADTVFDVLAQAQIAVGKYDRIDPAPQTALSPGDTVRVSRVQLRETTETEPLAYGKTYRSSSLLKTGASRTLSPGAQGELTHTYLERIVDGVVEDRVLIRSETTRESVSESVLLGSGEVVSNLDFDIEVDENGVPLHYTRVLRNQICTGYSGLGKRVRGASGMWLSAGCVAVRADEIPYGTRMYITASDGGSFVYGCAIAADTGVALMQNIIDVDLFYDTYMESRLNGRRICDVYILD